MGFHITRFFGPDEALDFVPTTVSVILVEVTRIGPEPPFVDATLAIGAGAVTGGRLTPESLVLSAG